MAAGIKIAISHDPETQILQARSHLKSERICFYIFRNFDTYRKHPQLDGGVERKFLYILVEHSRFSVTRGEFSQTSKRTLRKIRKKCENPCFY